MRLNKSATENVRKFPILVPLSSASKSSPFLALRIAVSSPMNA